MNIQEQEERDFVVATDADWDRAEASEIGAQNSTQAWILTDRDVWHPNPYYVGEIVPHPEYDTPEDYDSADEVCSADDVVEWPEGLIPGYDKALDEL